MLPIALFFVLQAPAESTPTTPKQDLTAPRPATAGIELPSGARVLYAIDGKGREAKRIDHLGKGIVGLGDVNGDGTPDFLVGSVSGIPGLTQERGFAEVRSGKDGAVLARVDGRDRPTNVAFGGDGFGIRVGKLNDLDGDGVGEFFVGGEPGLEPPYLNVYSGKSAALLRTFVSGSGVLEGLFDPLDLRAIGDVDGDGKNDYALVCESKTCLLAGGSWKKLRTLEGECIGRSADVDGDGVRDFFSLLDAYPRAGEPVAGILSGKTGTGIAKTKAPTGPLHTWSWGASGDANGDGFLDLVCCFYEGPAGGNTWPAKEQRFFTQLISGADASVLREWHEELEAPGDLNDVRFVGDIDGDACDEFAIGHAASGGSVTLFSGKDGKRLARFAAPGWSFGVRVARLGDLDGDGRGELAIGEHEHGECGGRVWVISLPRF